MNTDKLNKLMYDYKLKTEQLNSVNTKLKTLLLAEREKYDKKLFELIKLKCKYKNSIFYWLIKYKINKIDKQIENIIISLENVNKLYYIAFPEA